MCNCAPTPRLRTNCMAPCTSNGGATFKAGHGHWKQGQGAAPACLICQSLMPQMLNPHQRPWHYTGMPEMHTWTIIFTYSLWFLRARRLVPEDIPRHRSIPFSLQAGQGPILETFSETEVIVDRYIYLRWCKGLYSIMVMFFEICWPWRNQ